MTKNIEFEYRFYDIDQDKIKEKIIKLGGKKIHDRMLMTVKVFTHPYNNNCYYIRIRNEQDEKQIFSTLTVKKFQKEFPIEHEIKINDNSEAEEILKMLGCKVKYIIEKIRETWFLEGSKEIVFDSYAGLPTFLEIDCKSLESLNNLTKKLELDVKKKGKKGIKHLYLEHYGIPLKSDWGDNFSFVNSNKIFEKYITKNKKKFLEIFNQQILCLNK